MSCWVKMPTYYISQRSALICKFPDIKNQSWKHFLELFLTRRFNKEYLSLTSSFESVSDFRSTEQVLPFSFPYPCKIIFWSLIGCMLEWTRNQKPKVLAVFPLWINSSFTISKPFWLQNGWHQCEYSTHIA